MALNSYTPNSKILSAQENANWNNFSNHGRNVTLKWTFSDSLGASTSNDWISVPDNVTWSRCDLAVATVPVGASIIVDIEKSTDGGATWVTIFTGGTNRPTVAASAHTGSTTTVDVNSAVKNNDLFRAKISQVGSTTAGADLSVELKGLYNLD